MADTHTIVQQALDLGDKELDCLRSQDTDRLVPLARERKQLMERLLTVPPTTGLRGRLQQLQGQQTLLTREARALQQLLKQEVMRVRGQNKRYSGYHNAAKVIPLSSRFVSRQG